MRPLYLPNALLAQRKNAVLWRKRRKLFSRPGLKSVYDSEAINPAINPPITNKLKCGSFSATFFLACLAAMELEGVVLEDL